MGAASLPPQMPKADAAAQAGPKELSPAQRLARVKTLAFRALAYWKVSSLLFVVGCGVALLVALNVKRSYRSECVVLVKPALKTDDREESPSEKAMKLAPKLKDTLLTRSRLEPIIKEYNLYPQTVEGRGMVDAVEEMRSHVGFRGRDSETFVISFEDENQERVKEITQRLADTMIDDFKKGNLSTSKQQTEFLQAEEQRSEEELEAANRALATFLSQHPEFASETGNSPFTPGGAARPGAGPFPAGGNAGGGGDAQLATLLRQKARLESEIRAAQTQPGTPQPPPPPNASVQELTRARDDAARRAAAAQADLADKRTRYTDQHPDVVQAKAQADTAAHALHVAEQQLEQAKATAAGTAPPPSPAAVAGAPPELAQKLNEVTTQIQARQIELAKHPPPKPGAAAAASVAPAPVEMSPIVALETEWARLLRATSDAKSKEEDLTHRLERARLRASATEASGDDQMEVIDPAYRPTRPSRGGRANAAMLGLLVALAVSLGYAFARVLVNDTLFDATDIEGLGIVPVLGVLPAVPHNDKPTGSQGPDPAWDKP